MQLTQRTLRRINIYSPRETKSGYIGRKTVPQPLGFVYAEVFPSGQTLDLCREGRKYSGSTTLILRRGAGVNCGDLAGIFGDAPDSRVTEVTRSQGHMTVKAESL